MNEQLFGGKFSATVGKKIHVAEVKKPGGDEEDTIQIIQFDLNAVLDEFQLRDYREGIARHVYAAAPVFFKTIDFGEQVESSFTLSEIAVSSERVILPKVQWKTLKVSRLEHTLDLVLARLACEAPYVEEHFLELARLKSLKTDFTLRKIQGELNLESEEGENVPVTISDKKTDDDLSGGSALE